MAKGEKRFSVGGRNVKRYTNEPFPAGEHGLVIAKGWEVKAPGAGSKSGLRYVNGYFTVPGVGEGRRLYHMFFVDLSEGSDGEAMVDRGGGVTEFIKALGLTDIPVGITKMKKKDGTVVDCLDPNQLANWLNSLDGTELTAKVKVEKRNDDPEKKQNRVDFFVEAEGSAEEEDGGGLEDDEEETDLDADEDEDAEESDDEEEADLDEDDEEEADEDEEPEEEEEEKPAPKKKVKKAAPAPAAKKKSKK